MDFTTSENFGIKVETIDIKNGFTSNESTRLTVENSQHFKQFTNDHQKNLVDFGRYTPEK